MRVLYFDCFSGISGDMAIASLIDLGVDENMLIGELEKLRLENYEIEIKRKAVNGIFGTDFNVILKNETHTHDDSRTFADIKKLIRESNLSIRVKKLSIDIFAEIAKAEAHVHNKTVDEIHFHEVGAIDSIIDIAGVSICLEELGIEKVYASALHDGKGFIKCQHGEIPVPVPAVMEMLKGTSIPMITEDINTELVTPTGMGIIKTICSDYGNMPEMNVERIGYGFGKRKTGKLNALRVVEGSMFEEDTLNEEIIMLDTNIDDMNAEILGYTLERLMKEGALDCFFTPIFMKKNRPAYKISVICKKEDEDRIVEYLFRETSSLGIRREVKKRYIMKRESIEVETKLGKVNCKLSSRGDIRKIKPEFDDCRKIAENNNLPLREVYDITCSEINDFLL